MVILNHFETFDRVIYIEHKQIPKIYFNMLLDTQHITVWGLAVLGSAKASYLYSKLLFLLP